MATPIQTGPLLFHKKELTGNLWTMSRQDLYNWLNALVQKPQAWDVDESLAPELRKILDQMLTVSLLNGANYNGNPDLRPDQHIYRRISSGWGKKGNASKFSVRQSWSHPGASQSRKDPIRSYWSSYDLLGLFLSTLGPAPQGATVKNFYLPLLALYGRWCHRISGNTKVDATDQQGGAGDPPFVFQCTWEDKNGQFFLGASLAGYMWKSVSAVGDWQNALKRARFDLLEDFHSLSGTGFTDSNRVPHAWDFNSSVTYSPVRETGTRFGNCAETYPFLRLMGNGWSTQERRRCSGLALKRSFMKMKTYDEAVILAKSRNSRNYEYLMGPCGNCRALITAANGSKYNFWPKV